MTTTTPKFDIKVQLTGEDGNAYAIMARVSKALKAAGATPEQISQYSKESMAGDYNDLLRAQFRWVKVL